MDLPLSAPNVILSHVLSHSLWLVCTAHAGVCIAAVGRNKVCSLLLDFMQTGMPVVPTPHTAANPRTFASRQPSPVVLHMPLLPGVRTWLGDFLELPPYQGPFDAVFMNAVFGNLADPRTALLKAALSLKPGGFAVVSHPMGRTWHQQLAIDAPDMVPHLLPDAQGLQGLIQDLPLQVVQYTDDPELYLAVLQVRRQNTL